MTDDELTQVFLDRLMRSGRNDGDEDRLAYSAMVLYRDTEALLTESVTRAVFGLDDGAVP